MAYIELHTEKLKTNYNYLDKLFSDNGLKWAIVTKVLCGNIDYLKEVVKLGRNKMCDSRISNLKAIKELDSTIKTAYIKPPAKSIIKDVIKYADVSYNTELETIRWLSNEAKKQNKQHEIVVMIELGDLREGVMGSNLIDFYEKIFMLPNIKVTGIGTNLNCLSGVYPSQDKLIQLSLYKQLIEATFKQDIELVSGGSSVVIPLLLRKQLPKAINHFRIGETLFFGNDLISGETIEGMEKDVLKLFSQIIEIHKKPKVPSGYMGENPSGESAEINEEDYGKKSYRAILDIGVLDVSKTDFLKLEDEDLEIIGASSDMLVIDLGKTNKNYNIGDMISFKISYMSALRLLNSDYIDKRIVG